MASLQESNGARHRLISDSVTIGRGRSNDVDLHDTKASRSHAELRLSEGHWRLVDLESRNGTFVNDRRVQRRSLRDGDRIQIGDSTLTFSVEEDEEETEIDDSRRLVSLVPDLSEREKEILALIAQGLTDRSIGEELFISASTVRSHLDRIKHKTGLRRRSELTRLALELRLAD